MSKRILIIDDEEPIRKAFTLALEDEGYDMDTASSGEEGIKKFKENPADLVFLDLKMPGINGVETLLEIRKIDAGVPVYIVTAFHKEFFDQLMQAKKDNIEFEVAEKPLGADQIVTLVKAVLDGPLNIND